MLTVAATVVLVALTWSFALRPANAGTAWTLLGPCAAYAIVSALAILRMRREGVLAATLRPRSGDLTLGALVAAMLFFGALLVKTTLAPHATGREGWLIRIYMQIGDPEAVQRHLLALCLGVALLAALEEIAWRGYVYSVLRERLGVRIAWPLTALLYAAAHGPTVVLLRDPFAGPNPLVVIGTLGCGLVWGVLVARTSRLPVAMFSHALLLWAVALQFPLWRLG